MHCKPRGQLDGRRLLLHKISDIYSQPTACWPICALHPQAAYPPTNRKTAPPGRRPHYLSGDTTHRRHSTTLGKAALPASRSRRLGKRGEPFQNILVDHFTFIEHATCTLPPQRVLPIPTFHRGRFREARHAIPRAGARARARETRVVA